VRIGIDIGGTKTEAVVTDPSGAVVAFFRSDSGRGGEGVVETTAAAVETVLTSLDAGLDDVETIGVGIPGVVTDGRVSHALNLAIEDFDLGAELGKRLGVAVHVENDADAATYGAWVLTGSRPRSMAYLNLGTGLAAGVIARGELWRGARGAVGEIGHVSIDPNGPADADGIRGRLETYASGSGVACQWGVDGVSIAEIFAAADAGDDRAEAIRDRVHFGAASAIRLLILTLDVEEVVVGGGLTRLGDVLVEGISRQFDEWGAASSFMRSLELESRFRLLDPDKPVAAVGAAMMGAHHG
jgi:predicted NBD/HSP70 family sugar kinase